MADTTIIYCRKSAVESPSGCVEIAFVLANLALRLGLDPELSLRRPGRVLVEVEGVPPWAAWAAMDEVLGPDEQSRLFRGPDS